MRRVYSSVRGDQLCPLGFHPQVRWPTRCKRCFRDYKEHADKRDSWTDLASSSPNLVNRDPSNRGFTDDGNKRSWTSATNLSKDDNNHSKNVQTIIGKSNSTLVLNTTSQAESDIAKLPKDQRRHSVPDSFNGDILDSFDSDERIIRRPKLKIKQVIDNGTTANNDVEYVIQFQKLRPLSSSETSSSNAMSPSIDRRGGTIGKNEFNRTTLDKKERLRQIENGKIDNGSRRNLSLKNSDVAFNMEDTRQHKFVKELQTVNKALVEEKGNLMKKINDLENQLYLKSYNEKQDGAKEFKSKLRAAETLCESLMDENEDMKKEIKELEEELYEIQDNFRDEQADEYHNLRKTLEQSNKNCRILSFKLRKFERKAEQLEGEKVDWETKYAEVKKLQDAIVNFGEKCKTRSWSKVTDMTSKLQLKRILDEMQKEIADLVNKVGQPQDTKEDVKEDTQKVQESKDSQIWKQYEALQKRIEEITKELTQAKENKQKSDRTLSQFEAEKKAWEGEKNTLGDEIEKLKNKLLSLSAEKLKFNNEALELRKKLEHEPQLQKKAQEYDELEPKYQEVLHSMNKFKTDNETLNRKVSQREDDLLNLRSGMEKLQNDMNTKENNWSLEKSRIEEKTRQLEKLCDKSLIDELKGKINHMEANRQILLGQLEEIKRINEDLNIKLQDYNAVSKVQKTFSDDTAALKAEIRRLKNDSMNKEKSKKIELTECKMRYEARIIAISEEIQSLQNQLSRYKRERDTYKRMLEGARNTIAELKSTDSNRQSEGGSMKSDNKEEQMLKGNISVLERQISCMEDELSETRLEASKLKTELVTEKSEWQIKLSEMQSRINELEEEKMLSSGRSKVPGIKVRMELAWQKERKEQQRLLQETATLAKDLRQTLYEVEKERDKERLENRRKHEQLNRVFDEEKDENKKKLAELQCDLMELRDAHAKLRTSNEKLRREKERHDKERADLHEKILNRHRLEHEHRNVDVVLQQIDELIKVFPQEDNKIIAEKPTTPAPPRRLKSPKSRDASPSLEQKDESKESKGTGEGPKVDVKQIIHNLHKLSQDLKEAQRKTINDNPVRVEKFNNRYRSSNSDSGRSTPKGRTLSRTNIARSKEYAWALDSKASSIDSLELSDTDLRRHGVHRDSSVDSQRSGGSTKSEIIKPEKKYNKGILQKITTKLKKSRSVDDSIHFNELLSQTSASETSLDEKNPSGGKNLKKKLSDIFKRSGRSNSQD